MTAPPGTIAFSVKGPIAREDLAGLCTRVCALFTENAPSIVLCDFAAVAADAVTVEALSRLQLAAQRHGCRVYLRNASEELRELVAFMGLADVLAGVEPRQ